MNNFHFDTWIQMLIQRWVDVPHAAHLVTGQYSPVKAAHRTLSDIPAAAIVGSADISNRVVVGRYLKADDVDFPNVSYSTDIRAVVIADNLGNLTHYISDISGLGVKDDGSGLELLWADCGVSAL